MQRTETVALNTEISDQSAPCTEILVIDTPHGPNTSCTKGQIGIGSFNIKMLSMMYSCFIFLYSPPPLHPSAAGYPPRTLIILKPTLGK